MIKNTPIGIIGGGNIGTSIVGGLIRHGTLPTTLHVVDRHKEKRELFQQQWQINVYENASRLLDNIQILILAVKPHAIKETLLPLRDNLQRQPTLLISVAAGITTTQIQQWLQFIDYPVVRAMPNTPALYGEGITGLFANKNVLPHQRELAENCLKAIGKTVWIPEENMMDVVTALSGSGPAYFFYMMDALKKAAIALGLPQEIASELTLCTALGSASMAIQSHTDLSTLQKHVTSPGGTTEQAIKVLKDGNMETLFANAIRAATQRGKEISQQYS